MDSQKIMLNSSWVLANAGSGKTFQIIQKILFLLLEGVKPEKILCLTFTNNAAFEMKSRLDSELGSLLMLDEDLLLEKLKLLNANCLKSNNKKIFVSNIRKLLGHVLEKREELKIQTIHSFCSFLLRKFSTEANINPNFKIIDEKKQIELIRKSLDKIAEKEKKFFLDFVDIFNNIDLINLSKLIIKNKENFLSTFNEKRFSKIFFINIKKINFKKEFENIFNNLPKGSLEKIIIAFENGIENERKNSILLKSINASSPEVSLEILEKVFLKDGYPKDKNFFPSKKIKKLFPEHVILINKIKQELFIYVNKIKEKNLLDKTKNLYKFAQKFLNFYYEFLKMDNYLDYNDLISNVLKILKKDYDNWIKFNLDEEIDHIIIDEAQDTSPEQWKIILEITNEFFSDERILNGEKTLNVVGDDKQSIYSFLGTRPEVFDEIRSFFEYKFKKLGLKLNHDILNVSYRSSPLILDFLNEIFSTSNDFKMFEIQNKHYPFYESMPGRIDICSFKELKRNIMKVPWTSFPRKPIKNKTNFRKKTLPGKIAKKIKNLLNKKRIHYEERKSKKKKVRKVEPKDILVLLRKRGKLYDEIIQEIKNLKIPVSESDKFLLYEELAIKDLISILKFLNDLNDDLSLAEALKSPLLEMSEEDLFKISVDRSGSLYNSLLKRLPKHPSLKILTDLVKVRNTILPFQLVQIVLVNHNGRERLEKRFGKIVLDFLDEFLDQLILYEETELPSLRGFLLWINDLDLYIKNDLNTIKNQVRIMTIHGSKGLESPIVILPDFFSDKKFGSDDILTNFDDFVIFNEKENRLLETTRLIKNKNIDISLEEEVRLFYVALTRAQSWLLIFGNELQNTIKKDKSWFFYCKKASDKIDKKKYYFKKNKKETKITIKYNWF